MKVPSPDPRAHRGLIQPVTVEDLTMARIPGTSFSDSNPPKVTVSKAAFDRAFRCRDFLEGVPETTLALKGTNQIIDLMLAVMRAGLDEATPITMLKDEIDEQGKMLTGQSPGYVPRMVLEQALARILVYLVDHKEQGLPVSPQELDNLAKSHPWCCAGCSGKRYVPGEIPKSKLVGLDGKPIEPAIGMGGYGMALVRCPKCNGFGIVPPDGKALGTGDTDEEHEDDPNDL